MAGRFEPVKSGEYIVEYRKENGSYEKETVQYDKKNNAWVGRETKEFYREHVISWYTSDLSPI